MGVQVAREGRFIPYKRCLDLDICEEVMIGSHPYQLILAEVL
jgi:hypothetical protein